MGNANNAYITKQANTVNPSDWINKQEAIGLKYDEIARQKEKDEQARQDTLRKEFDSDFEGEFDLASMGNDAVNKIFTPMAMQSLQDLKEAKDEGEKALNSYGINSKEYKSARTRYDNILKRPNLFKLAFEQTASKLNAHNELVQSGDVYQNPNSIDKLQTLLTEPIKYKQDKEGRYILMHGDKAYTMDEFADKLDFGKSIHKVDSSAIISGVTDKVGTKEYMDRMGYTTNTVTNPWDDYTDPNTNEKKKGIKSVLTNAFESSLTDEVVESVLAGKGEFGYDEMPQETKDKLKAGIVNDWLEIGRGQVEEKTGVKFDSSRYNQDSRNSKKDNNSDGSSSFTHIEDTYSNGNYRTSVYAPAEPIVPKNTNKAANPVTYDGIIYDDESKTISLTGRKLTNNNKSPEFAEYKKLKQESSKANIKWQNNKDEAIEEQLRSEYFALESQVDIALESLKTVKGAWEETTVTDKRQVATLLKGTLNVNSYDEMVKILSRKEKQKEKETTTEAPKTKPTFPEWKKANPNATYTEYYKL